jgi:predicted nucleotidyltransferase
MIQAADPVLTSITRTIVERFVPERVLLFGSRARDEARHDSDYDLMIVIDDPAGDRKAAIHEAIGREHSVDVVVVTPERFEWARDDVGTLSYVVEREGRVLYDRNPTRWVRRVREERNGRPRSFDDWIERALSSYGTMEREFASQPQARDSICYMAQQGGREAAQGGARRVVRTAAEDASASGAAEALSTRAAGRSSRVRCLRRLGQALAQHALSPRAHAD